MDEKKVKTLSQSEKKKTAQRIADELNKHSIFTRRPCTARFMHVINQMEQGLFQTLDKYGGKSVSRKNGGTAANRVPITSFRNSLQWGASPTRKGSKGVVSGSRRSELGEKEKQKYMTTNEKRLKYWETETKEKTKKTYNR